MLLLAVWPPACISPLHDEYHWKIKNFKYCCHKNLNSKQLNPIDLYLLLYMNRNTKT